MQQQVWGTPSCLTFIWPNNYTLAVPHYHFAPVMGHGYPDCSTARFNTAFLHTFTDTDHSKTFIKNTINI